MALANEILAISTAKLKEGVGSNIEITNELKFSGLNEEFEWTFPNIKYGEDYEFWKEVKGKIFTTVTPIKDTDLSGIYLTSRGKIVNNASFYDLRDNDHYHTYVTGYLEVDFIDDFNEEREFISPT